jgi:ketosteroid isomerase-like protein
MDEQDNVAAIKKMYADFGAGDILGVLNAMSEDIVWKQAPNGPPPFAGTIRGREPLSEWFHEMETVSDRQTCEPREFIARGNKVVVLGHYAVRSRATGKLWESDWVHIWTFNGRQVVEGQVLEDTLALAAALAWRP